MDLQNMDLQGGSLQISTEVVVAIKKDVTNLSGVPSWMMAVITRVLELSGKQYLDEEKHLGE